MYQPYSRRVCLEINLSRLCDNFRRIAERVAPCRIMAVLKANAYGLGARPIATALREAGVAGFGVAELNEALELRDIGVPVQILGGVLPQEVANAVSAGVVLPITDIETAQRISSESVRQKTVTTCHFLIDTGMGRLGIPVRDAEDVIIRSMLLPGIKCNGIYTHFPVAYMGGIEYTTGQITKFRNLLDSLTAQNIDFDIVHTANSDAINNVPEAFATPFNLVRTGINLYGAFDTEGRRSLNLQSVLHLRTRLAAVRLLPAGMSIGYGCTFTLPRDMLIGTIAAGYADGLPLALSNRGHVLINEKPCPVLGRVSMDYTTVDLSQVPNAKPGDDAVCLGGSGPAAILVEDWARLKNTHSYDIICSIGGRVERVYTNPS